jgi:predicted Zn-dependent protease
LLGDADGAADALNRAVLESDSDSEHAEARYHLGRVLLTAGNDLARAQSELEAAAQADPDDPAIQYYLGAAIRAFFEKESLAKASRAWEKYLDAGAPLGHREEVEAFVAASREVR